MANGVEEATEAAAKGAGWKRMAKDGRAGETYERREGNIEAMVEGFREWR